MRVRKRRGRIYAYNESLIVAIQRHIVITRLKGKNLPAMSASWLIAASRNFFARSHENFSARERE